MAKTTTINITRTKHKKNPFEVRVEDGKTDIMLAQRFASYFSARRAVERKGFMSKAYAIHCYNIMPLVGETVLRHNGEKAIVVSRNTIKMNVTLKVKTGDVVVVKHKDVVILRN